MNRAERAIAYAEEAVRNALWSDIKFQNDAIMAVRDFAHAYMYGAKDADTHPAWCMCEDEMPTDPHQPYWVYAKCCGECCVAYIQEKTNIFYDEGGEELSGVVAWLPLPKFNPKAKNE